MSLAPPMKLIHYLQKHKLGMTLLFQTLRQMIRLENNDKWLSFNLTVSFSTTVQAPNPYNGVRKKNPKEITDLGCVLLQEMKLLS